MPNLITEIQDGDFYYPIDLADNMNQPFIKLRFFDWSMQSSGDTIKLIASITNTFYLAMPQNTIMEDFSHRWTTAWDWTQSSKKGVSSMAKGAVDFLSKKSKGAELFVEYIGISQGKKINDFQALAYDNLDLRQFEYMFDLIPRNQQEAEMIFKIISKLKQITLPDYTNEIITFPQICDATVYSGGNNVVYNTMLSGVQKLNLDYSPSGFMRTFKDGKPVQVKMVISINEIRRVTWEHLSSGAY